MMQKGIFIFLLLSLELIQSLFAQTPQDTALQWLHQHQGALTYRNQSNEDEGYIEKSFRFLHDKIVERTVRYDKDKQLLSSDEQDWLYSDFELVDDIGSLPIDTVNSGKLGLIRLMMTGPSLNIINENGEYTGAISYPVFEIGFLMGDNIAKQTVLDAIKALVQLASKEAAPVSKFTLENPHLIAKTEVLLTNICRDNYNRKKWNEAKKLEETY